MTTSFEELGTAQVALRFWRCLMEVDEKCVERIVVDFHSCSRQGASQLDEWPTVRPDEVWGLDTADFQDIEAAIHEWLEVTLGELDGAEVVHEGWQSYVIDSLM